MKFLLTILFVSTLDRSWSQEENKIIDAGNNFYRHLQYDKAEAEYRKALQIAPADQNAKFNLANSLIKQNKTDEADKLLAELNKKENKNDLRSMASYNRAVILTQQKKLEESIEAYKATLRIDAGDKEARENLQKALLELKKKNPPKKQDEKKKQQQQQQKPKLNPKEVQQHLQMLEQKEKQIQQRIQKNSSKTGNSQPKDW